MKEKNKLDRSGRLKKMGVKCRPAAVLGRRRWWPGKEPWK
jgi:hypothetical protein